MIARSIATNMLIVTGLFYRGCSAACIATIVLHGSDDNSCNEYELSQDISEQNAYTIKLFLVKLLYHALALIYILGMYFSKENS